LKKVDVLVKKEGYCISNIDAILILQKPKIAPFIPKMKETLASLLQIKSTQVAIKATTTEHLGYEGREEGISAFANVLIYTNQTL
jgi:2-C-methyl-D-erythritol 2,4-cyclodiphosphate synthase